MRKNISTIIILLFVFIFSINVNAATKNNSNNSLKGNKTSNISDDYKLYQNFPNPFNPATILSYKINQSGFVTLKVYNLVGQVVATLVDDYQEVGTYSKQFDASNLSAGVYLYKLQVNNFTSVKRMTLIK
ncbi:MAG TPA: T9SS type A sorting domain-containing protein [Ignavibacteria bacterium]|nr:T9SS type A sorting domain-containing protein [Ignavibacteria bacterium]HMR39206.1 T9SS type A sorting domain-containing protein [Ignavibacteria bacterium]